MDRRVTTLECGVHCNIRRGNVGQGQQAGRGTSPPRKIKFNPARGLLWTGNQLNNTLNKMALLTKWQNQERYNSEPNLPKLKAKENGYYTKRCKFKSL